MQSPVELLQRFLSLWKLGDSPSTFTHAFNNNLLLLHHQPKASIPRHTSIQLRYTSIQLRHTSSPVNYIYTLCPHLFPAIPRWILGSAICIKLKCFPRRRRCWSLLLSRVRCLNVVIWRTPNFQRRQFKTNTLQQMASHTVGKVSWLWLLYRQLGVMPLASAVSRPFGLTIFVAVVVYLALILGLYIRRTDFQRR